MRVNFARIHDLLAAFDFEQLFIEELGWSRPTSRKPVDMTVSGAAMRRRQIAQLAGVAVFEIAASDGRIPDVKTRLSIHREIAKLYHENLLIFVDQARTQSTWYWVKREDGKLRPRDHHYFKGQPGDLFIGKLSGMVFDLGDFDEAGDVAVVEVAKRLKGSLDVERVTKQFYRDYEEQHLAFLELIQGVPDEHDRRWYASVLLNRLMFIYFLQRKGFLDYKNPTARDGNQRYLQDKLADSAKGGRNKYFTGFLRVLFFEGFAKPEGKRTAGARRLLGNIRYLNGGLFLPHQVEQDCPKLNVPDKAFENLFALFERYSWNLNDTPGERDDEIRPDVLGYIFEKYINQKAFGAYYTRNEITEYLCEQTIHRIVLDAINGPGIPGVSPPRQFETIGDLLMDLDAKLCRRLLLEVLPGLGLLDPACGSGAFLVAAMRTLINVYSAVIGRIKFLHDTTLSNWLKQKESEHPSLAYFIKKAIIADNLYGVDIMEEATEIARLRLFLSLVASAESVEQLEPLPNIEFNILPGNSLIGLMRVDDQQFEKRMEGQLFRQRSYRQMVDEKNRLIQNFRHTATYADDLTALRDTIEATKQTAREILGDLLLAEFEHLGIKYEEATWDDKKNDAGKPIKRPLRIEDIHDLKPFHWGYEFDEILNQRGGFDAIITNPPWEIFKPNAKEFFEDHSDLVSKKNMTVHEFDKEQAKLLKDKDIRTAWLSYLSGYPHVSAYYRFSPQYPNQVSVVSGKKAGTDINLYKLFVEQCYNLLRPDGRCGIIVPGSIYNDLGAKQLRQMLFTQTRFDTIIGLSNERYIFDGVHHDQKFCLLAFSKGGTTAEFVSRFRINVREAIGPEDLDTFLHGEDGSVRITTEAVKRLSPDSLSIMDFRSQRDLDIAEKMLKFPTLRESIPDRWSLTLCNEFHMTGDSDLFQTSPGPGRLPLMEGKMFHQFDHRFAEPRFWINEKRARERLRAARLKAIRKVSAETGSSWDDEDNVLLDYSSYRLAFRDVGTSTNERSMIMTILPPNVFCPHTVSLEQVYIPIAVRNRLDANAVQMEHSERLFVCAVMNSFVVDAWIKRTISKHVSFFYVYALPCPRWSEGDPGFKAVVERSARLICTTSEFDALAKKVGLGNHRKGAAAPEERARLRAELDGLIAHMYGLTEEEFAYILTTFPLVPDPVKVAAQNAYRDVTRGLLK